MQLKDLIGRPASELTDEELEYKINMMKKLRLVGDVASAPDDGGEEDENVSFKPRKKAKVKTTKETKNKKLLDSLDEDELSILREIMAGKKEA